MMLNKSSHVQSDAQNIQSRENQANFDHPVPYCPLRYSDIGSASVQIVLGFLLQSFRDQQ